MRTRSAPPQPTPTQPVRPRRLALLAGSATPLLLGAVLAAAPAAADAAAPVATHSALAPNVLFASPFSADPDAVYTGTGVNGRGTFSLQTDSAGNVSFYSAEWRKTVCGIPDFGLYFDAAGGTGIPVDDAGIFIEEYTITYRSKGKRYTVKATDSAQIGLVTDVDGETHDQVTFRERVKVKRQAKGAKWCSGVHKKAFVAYRVSGGA